MNKLVFLGFDNTLKGDSLMLIMLLIIFFAASVTLIFAVSNNIYRFLFIYWIGIFVLLFSSTLLVIKFGNYPQIFSLDYLLYKALINIKVLPSVLLRIYNIGYAIIMTASICIYISLTQKNTLSILISVFMGILVLVYLLLNDPTFKFNYYLCINYESYFPKTAFLKNLEGAFKAVSIGSIILLAILPVHALIRKAKRTMLRTICNSYLAYTSVLVLLDMYVAIVFIFGPFKAFSPLALNLLSIPMIEFSRNAFVYLIIFGMINILTILMVIFMSQPFKSALFFSKKDIENQEHFFNKNINILIHSDKNAFVIIKKYASLTQNELADKEHAFMLLNKIISRSEKSISQLNDVTKALNTNGVPFEKINIYKCIYAALEKVNIPNSILVVTNFDMLDSININANSDLLTEAFYNITDNAVASLLCIRKKSQLCLKVLVEIHDNSLFIEFEDNGLGISHRDQKSVFKEFYTPKNTTSNLGLGLSSAKKIINLHKGMITVKSILKKYTCFCIILPLKG